MIVSISVWRAWYISGTYAEHWTKLPVNFLLRVIYGVPRVVCGRVSLARVVLVVMLSVCQVDET